MSPLVSSPLRTGSDGSMGLISPFLRIMGGLPTRMWTSLHPWSTALLSTCTRSMAPPAGPMRPGAPHGSTFPPHHHQACLACSDPARYSRAPGSRSGFDEGDQLHREPMDAKEGPMPTTPMNRLVGLLLAALVLTSA